MPRVRICCSCFHSPLVPFCEGRYHRRHRRYPPSLSTYHRRRHRCVRLRLQKEGKTWDEEGRFRRKHRRGPSCVFPLIERPSFNRRTKKFKRAESYATLVCNYRARGTRDTGLARLRNRKEGLPATAITVISRVLSLGRCSVRRCTSPRITTSRG